MAASGYVGGDPAKVSDAGDTMTGALALSGDPVSALQAATKQYVDGRVATRQPLDAVLTALSGLDLPSDTVLVRDEEGFRLATFAEFRALLDIQEGGASSDGTLFNVESHGAVADGATDCYQAILDTRAAIFALSKGGKLYFPSLGTYRVDLHDPTRVVVHPDKQYAAFPTPVAPRTGPKLAYGVKGVGEPYTERAAELGGEPGQVHTASVLWFDYDPADFAWDPVKGLPSIFGCADADMTDPVGNTFSQVHFSAEDIIFRSPPNPSLTVLNMEQCSTARLGRVRFDISVVLDLVPLCTNPTGLAFLLPRSNNNVAIQVDSVVVCGYYGGIHLTEHCEIRRGMAFRCRVGAFTRRPNSHTGLVVSLKTEQCPWGISGLDPTTGVVPFHGWSGSILMWGNEDYAYRGQFPEIYAPLVGAHINDPNGAFTGEIGAFSRMNSEPEDDPDTVEVEGVGLPPTGGSHSLVVVGINGTTQAPVAIYGPHHDQQATRLPAYNAPTTTEHRMFAGQSGPSTAPTEGAGINVGLKVRFTEACEAVRLMFWRLNSSVNPTGGRLWKFTSPSTWESLGDVAFTIEGTAVWIPGDLPAPVALQTEGEAPGVTYVPTIHYPGNYPREGDYWGGGPGGSGLVLPPFKVYGDVDAGGQGCFSMGDISVPPTISGSGADYGVDMVVTTEG